jgi:pyrroline-5-carboxylate reductase
VVQPSNPKRDQLAADFSAAGVQVAADVTELGTEIDVVVWAVKPQVLQRVIADNQGRFGADTLHVSIAAGVGTAALSDWLGNDRVVRTMPNTPAMVGCGATGMFAKEAVSADDKTLVQALFSATGLCLWVAEEGLLEAVTAVSGSGPAYVFYILNAMTAGGRALGLTESTAKQLAIATFAGAAELARQSTDTPAQLQQNVTSKGGATAEAIAVFESAKLAETIQTGMRACAARATEMGAQFK